MVGGIRSSARWSCDLSGGLRSSKITASCSKEDIESIVDSVSRRSDALEPFSISHYSSGAFAWVSDRPGRARGHKRLWTNFAAEGNKQRARYRGRAHHNLSKLWASIMMQPPLWVWPFPSQRVTILVISMGSEKYSLQTSRIKTVSVSGNGGKHVRRRRNE